MYSKNAIRIYSFVISIIIMIVLQQSGMKVYKLSTNIKKQVDIQENFVREEIKQETEDIIESQNKMPQQNIENDSEQNLSKEQKEIWQLMIPKIDLIAPIQEGVDKSTIQKTIGHFPETSVWEGNIGLASHNRGSRANFFENIKQLIKGDIIIYQKGNNQKQYVIEKIAVIVENDWSYLQKTSDNRITLITCIMNQPDYRLCIQGIESF